MTDPAIDPTADVADDVAIGDGVSIGGRARVRPGVQLGDGVVVGRDALVDAGVTIGDGSTVHDRALVYSGATIGRRVFVGPGAIVTNERYPRAVRTTAEVTAGAPDPSVVMNDSSTIGAGAVIVAGVEIGRFAMVGAGAIVTTHVPSHALVAGNPARRLGWMCACGRRLVDANGDPAPAEPAQYAQNTGLSCPHCGRVYRYVPDADSLEERSGPRPGAPA